MKNTTQKGYTVLFAVLVSSLVLAIGLGIIHITLKEITLSASGRDSQFAFYAADTAAECALFWDLKGTNIFATSSETTSPDPVAPSCVGVNILASDNATYETTSTAATTTFHITFPDPERYYAEVKIAKNHVEGESDTTVIDARGYNAGPGTQRRTERGLRITY